VAVLIVNVNNLPEYYYIKLKTKKIGYKNFIGNNFLCAYP